MIAIIDYGMGNIHSVQKALDSLGAKTLVTNNASEIKKCDKAVLPGVGAFGDALAELKKQDLISALREHIRQEKVFLGICLGMQLLFEASGESPRAQGMGVLKGKVEKLESKNAVKVPHIGWNQIKQVSSTCPLLKDIPDNSYVYFCHSYYALPQNKEVIAAVCEYGADFSAIIWQKNIYGLQFHPEKSQNTGLRILKNFIDLC